MTTSLQMLGIADILRPHPPDNRLSGGSGRGRGGEPVLHHRQLTRVPELVRQTEASNLDLAVIILGDADIFVITRTNSSMWHGPGGACGDHHPKHPCQPTRPRARPLRHHRRDAAARVPQEHDGCLLQPRSRQGSPLPVLCPVGLGPRPDLRRGRAGRASPKRLQKIQRGYKNPDEDTYSLLIFAYSRGCAVSSAQMIAATPCSSSRRPSAWGGSEESKGACLPYDRHSEIAAATGPSGGVPGRPGERRALLSLSHRERTARSLPVALSLTGPGLGSHG